MSTLLYCPNPADLTKALEKHNANNTVTLTGPLETSLKTLKENQHQNAYIHVNSSKDIEQALLFAAYNILQPGGTVTIELAEDLDSAQVNDLVMISGLVDLRTEGKTLKASKPAWAGQAAPVSLKNRNKVAANGDQNTNGDSSNGKTQETTKANPFAKFKIDNSDLVDEDDLLKDDPGYNKLATAEDCSTKPKACKNCSCGRKEELEAQEEAATVTKKLENNEIKSSCGNCYLGDAFRCGGCPFKGLPAFKPGDKIKLDLSKDTMALNAAQEDGQIKLANGKVKLEI